MYKKELIEERAKNIGRYFVDTKCTVRQCAKNFNCCPQTVHNDLTSRLRDIDFELYCKAKEILEVNKKERSIRGALAVKMKYRKRGVKNGF